MRCMHISWPVSLTVEQKRISLDLVNFNKKEETHDAYTTFACELETQCSSHYRCYRAVDPVIHFNADSWDLIRIPIDLSYLLLKRTV